MGRRNTAERNPLRGVTKKESSKKREKYWECEKIQNKAAQNWGTEGQTDPKEVCRSKEKHGDGENNTKGATKRVKSDRIVWDVDGA